MDSAHNKLWKPKHDITPAIVTHRRKQPAYSLQRGVPQMRSDKVNREDIVKPTENTIPVIIDNSSPPSHSSFIQVPQDRTAEDKPVDGHLKVCTVNTQSIRNKTGDVVEHVLSNKIDIWAVVTEKWLKPANDATRQDCQPVGLFIHRLSPPKWQGRCRHWPFVQVKSHTIFGAIRREHIIWLLWMTHKISSSCHKIDRCLSAKTLKGTSSFTSHI